MPYGPVFHPLKKRVSARGVILFSLIVFLFLSAFSPLPQDPPGGDVLDRILNLALSFGALVGVSGAVGMIVAFLQAFNVIKTDEQVGRVTAGLNLAAFIALVAFGVFRPDLSLELLDSLAAKIAAIGLFVLGFIIQMITPAPVMRLFYQARVPLLGTIGERYESRAHFAGPVENWTATPEPRDKTR